MIPIKPLTVTGNPTSEEQAHFMDTLKKWAISMMVLTNRLSGAGEPVWHIKECPMG